MKSTFAKTVFAVAISASASLALADGAVIANADSGISSASKSEIQDLFLGKTESLGGSDVSLMEQPEGSDIRGEFAQDVLSRSESQLSSYWSKQVFTGKGEPPDSGSPSEVVDFVKSTSNGVTYVDAANVPDGVNVILEF